MVPLMKRSKICLSKAFLDHLELGFHLDSFSFVLPSIIATYIKAIPLPLFDTNDDYFCLSGSLSGDFPNHSTYAHLLEKEYGESLGNSEQLNWI